MNEFKDAGLVSWDEVQNMGRIPGSDWVCPNGRKTLRSLGLLDAAGVEIDDELILLCGGQRQHLELLQFPEGFQAAQIVNSETEAVLTEERSATRYFGLHNCATVKNEPRETSAVGGSRHIPFGSDRQISLIENMVEFHATRTVIRPDPDNRCFELSIIPGIQAMGLRANGRLPIFDSENTVGSCEVNAADKSNAVRGRVEFSISSQAMGWCEGSIKLVLDRFGQAGTMEVDRPKILAAIGLSASDVTVHERNVVEISDEGERTAVLDALANKLGYPRWSGYDLRSTATNLYAAFGDVDLTVANALVPAT